MRTRDGWARSWEWERCCVSSVAEPEDLPVRRVGARCATAGARWTADIHEGCEERF